MTVELNGARTAGSQTNRAFDDTQSTMISSLSEDSSSDLSTGERLGRAMSTEDRLKSMPSKLDKALSDTGILVADAVDAGEYKETISARNMQLASASVDKIELGTQNVKQEKGFFPSSVVDDIRDYISGNALKRDISIFLPDNVVWGKDCIKLHNGIIKDVLFKNEGLQLGDKIIGKGSTHAKLLQAGKAGELKSFGILTEQGKPARGNAVAYSLKESVGHYIEENYRGSGVQVYGISVNDGYHSVTLTYGKNEKGELEYHLIDNGGATSRITGHTSFKTAQELDNALNEYLRADHTRDYRVGSQKNMQIPARIDVYEIYSGK